jgi:hypothetical protein
VSDFYYNSWRLVPANVVWGVGFLVVLYFSGRAFGLMLLLVPFLALPTAGLFRLAALIVRGDAVALSDAFAAWRAYAGPALAAGLAFTVLATIFVLNVAIGLASGGILGAVLAAFAGWGLLVLGTATLTFWPLLVDPRRADVPLRGRARLAGILVVAFPLRLGVLLLVIGAFLALSTVLFAALLTVSVAVVALVASRYVLPLADRFEGRATELVVE